MIRYNEAISILHRVFAFKEKSFMEQVSSQKPFGLATNFRDFKTARFKNSIKLVTYKKTGYICREQIIQNRDWIDRYKVYISRAYGERIAKFYWVTGKPFLGEPRTCCTETYLVIGPYSKKAETENVMSYMRTRFFRFMVLLIKNTQDALKKVYSFVPVQDFDEPWMDDKLYKKYGLTKDEIAFIESMVRPMEPNNE